MNNSMMASWESVTKTYRNQTALAEFSLSLGPGANYLLGPNGAGKTTALSVLTGVRAATKGKAQVMGISVKRGGPQTKLLGAAPQALDFPPTLSVAEILRFVAIHYPNPLPIDSLSGQLGLEPILDKKCGTLSGGQRRRLGLAAALLPNTPVLVLDEPLTGLDIEGRASVREIIHDQRAQGRCLIIASHDFAEVETTADTITLLKMGRVIAEGTSDALRGTLDIYHLDFSAENIFEAPTEIGTLTTVGEHRYRLTTRDPDNATRYIMNHIDSPKLLIARASLEEAVNEILVKEGK